MSRGVWDATPGPTSSCAGGRVDLRSRRSTTSANPPQNALPDAPRGLAPARAQTPPPRGPFTSARAPPAPGRGTGQGVWPDGTRASVGAQIPSPPHGAPPPHHPHAAVRPGPARFGLGGHFQSFTGRAPGAGRRGDAGMHWKRGGGTPPPLQDAQPMPSHCPPHAKCQLQWHL